MNKKTIGYISIVALLSVTSLFSINLYFQQRTSHDEIDINIFPDTIGDWKGRDLEIKENVYKILETRNLILREYVNSANDKLTLFIIYSETNRSVFHPPEACLIGSDIKIVDKKIENINEDGRTFTVNKLHTEKDDYRGMSLYCYKTGNFYTANFYLQQIFFALNQLLGKDKGGATIRASMSIKKDEETTLAILKDFIKESVKVIDKL